MYSHITEAYSPGSRGGGGGSSRGGSGSRSSGPRSSSPRSSGKSIYGPLGPKGNLPNYNRSYSPEYNFTSSGYGMYYPYQYNSFPGVNIHYELVPVVTGSYGTNLACPDLYKPCSVPLTQINQPGSNFNYLTYQ